KTAARSRTRCTASTGGRCCREKASAPARDRNSGSVLIWILLLVGMCAASLIEDVYLLRRVNLDRWKEDSHQRPTAGIDFCNAKCTPSLIVMSGVGCGL